METQVSRLADGRDVRYWRDKQHHEIDFVIAKPGAGPTAIECKLAAAQFEPDNLHIFRRRYPKGINLVVTSDTVRPFERRYGEVAVRFVGIDHIGALVS